MLVSSPLSRRTVLKRSGVGVMALSLPVSGWAASPVQARVAVPALRRSTWLPLVGQSVAVAGGPELRVDGVTDLAGATPDAGLRDLDEAFVVELSAVTGTELGSGLQELRHPAFGSAVLFLSPVGGPGARARFELVVDRTVRIAAALDAPQLEDAVAATALSAVAPAASVAPAGPASTLGARRMRVRATARRIDGRVVATLAFPGGGVQAVRVALYRDGRRVATGTGAVRRGAASIPLRARRRLGRGRYDVVLTVTDRRTQVVTLHRTITVR